MNQFSTIGHQTLGADLRALRKSRGLTLEEMARELDRSTGWLSQVERALSKPTDEDIRLIAAMLDVPLSMLQTDIPHDDAQYVVRAGERRKMAPRVDGLVEELLSPDLTDDFEVVHSIFHPGAHRTEATLRPTQELAYIVSGKLDVEIGDRAFTIAQGDSMRLRGETFSWSNPYDVPAIAIWVIAPPVY